MDHFHLPMPKPSSPPDLDSQSPAPEHHLTQAQAASMRRKKNADAQAAFRARRANYIASLEETVTSLEAVVMSLQDTCRDARTDAEDLRHENAKLAAQAEAMRLAAREREKEWREWWHAKQQALGLDLGMHDCPPPRPEPQSQSQSQAQPPPQPQPRTQSTSQFFTPTPYPHAPALKEDPRAPYTLQPFPESAWGPFSHTRTPCVGEAHPSQSSSASDSPPAYGGTSTTRYGDDPARTNMSLVNLGAYRASPDALYAHAPPFDTGLAHHDWETGERGYGRPRRSYSGPGREMYAGPAAGEEAGHAETRPRRHTSASLMPGPSPPATPPPLGTAQDEREPQMSNTLAVIKAQAFGSLRRTRTRGKKASDAASKVAIDILAARGIGMGVQSQSQRKRKDEDEGDVDM